MYRRHPRFDIEMTNMCTTRIIVLPFLDFESIGRRSEQFLNQYFCWLSDFSSDKFTFVMIIRLNFYVNSYKR